MVFLQTIQLSFSSSLSVGALAVVLDFEERFFSCHSWNFWFGGLLDITLELLDVMLVAEMATGVTCSPLSVWFELRLIAPKALNV